MQHDTILVFNFGGQYCHLIARRIREQNVYSEIVSPDIKLADIKKMKNIKGIILSGSPYSIYNKDAPKIDPDILKSGIPVLGLCYGAHLIAHQFKGTVKKGTKKEYGTTLITIDENNTILKGLKKKQKVWMSHGDSIYSLPDSFQILAHSANTPITAFKYKNLYGLQWHPEVVHTENGNKMLSNFVFDICKCKPSWQLGDFISSAVKEIKKEVGNSKAILGLSGGVDSSVVSTLASKALGKKLFSVFVDHGFMRAGEPEEIEKSMKRFNLNFIRVNAKDVFLKALVGITDPEKKRKIIGEKFIRTFEKEASKINAKCLLQGTIYPDRIESGIPDTRDRCGVQKHSDTIKTHHNVGGLPTNIKFEKIVEPLKDLYKDEVRKVGKKLGLPHSLVERQPFPGPGLAVRIMGEVTDEKLNVIKTADKIVTTELERAKLNLWQYFAVLTNTYSTGVKGDQRAYGYTIAIRAVESREAMTANFAKIPYKVLEHISTRLTNELPKVNRVVYDITHKPPATIEWE